SLPLSWSLPRYCDCAARLARWHYVLQRRTDMRAGRITSLGRLSRRRLLQIGTAGLAGASFGGLFRATAAPVTIRYATGGGIGPNEMETIIYLDYLKENVLKNYGKSYTLEMTFTRGTPEAATLLASGQADLGTLAFSTFATAIAKDAVAGGLSIISDNYQDGSACNTSYTVFLLPASPILTVSAHKCN